jgi:glycosyltransferase involved in cell wall biosynthesis
VLLEAGACQIPIVASDVGGTREIFPLPSQALLVPAGDPAAVATALSSALDDSQYAADLGREARIRIAAHFNSARAASALLAHYHHLLAP